MHAIDLSTNVSTGALKGAAFEGAEIRMMSELAWGTKIITKANAKSSTGIESIVSRIAGAVILVAK